MTDLGGEMMMGHLKHMAEVRPQGLDLAAAHWALAEIKRLTAVLREIEDHRRYLEDVSCRQQNEIARLKTRASNLWSVLDRVKHGAEYPDELGDIIDRALTTQSG